MKIDVIGQLNLLPHPTIRNLKVTDSDILIKRGPWFLDIPQGTPTNGASIPWPFNRWVDKYDKDYAIATLVHDCLVGEFTNRMHVTSVGGLKRVLSWKESAVWMRELMKIDYDNDGEKDNSKLVRKTFYHSVMLYKRLGIRKVRVKK